MFRKTKDVVTQPMEKFTRQLKVVLINLKLKRPTSQETINTLDERRKTYACYVCMAKFSNSDELHKHKKTHESDAEDDLFEEDYVPDKESKENNNTVPDSSDVKMKPGKKRGRKKKVPVLTPPINSVTVTTEATKTDPPSTFDNIETPFKCDTCKVYFATSDDAKKHIAVNAKCKFSCRLCNRKFNTLYAFVVHVMQHKSNAGKNQRPLQVSYICKSCGKDFDDCFKLKRHEVTVHQIRVASNYQPLSKQLEKEKDKEDDLEKIAREIEVNIQSEDITCELCYDIFTSNDELNKHMEFHKQLERISTVAEPVADEPDNANVEVIEDKRSKHDIVANIQVSKPKLPKPTSHKELTELSDKIKEMLKPNIEKVSKTILLSTPVTLDPRFKKMGPKFKTIVFPKKQLSKGNESLSSSLKVNTSTSSTVTSSHTDQVSSTPTMTRTYPSLVGNIILPSILTSSISTTNFSNVISTVPGSSTKATNSTVVSSTGTNSSSIINPAHKPSFTLTDSNTKFAYVIIPHQSSPTSSGMPPLSINVLMPSTIPKTVTSNTVSNTTLPLITNVTSLSTSSTENDPIDNIIATSSCTVSTSTNNSSSYTSMLSSPVPSTSTFTSSTYPQNIITPTSAPSEIPEIVLIESSSEDEEFTEEISKNEQSINKNDNPNKDGNTSSTEILNITKTSEVEEGGDLVIDENSAHELTKTKTDETVITETASKSTRDDTIVSSTSTIATPPLKGGLISVRKLEDLLDPETIKKVEKKKKLQKVCELCGIVFNKHRSYTTHKKKQILCTIPNCDYKCCKITDLKNHCRDTHNLYICLRCKLIFDTLKLLKEHRKIHTCTTCQGIFTNLAEHNCKVVAKAKVC